MTGLYALNYAGGKAVSAMQGTGGWITSMLPWTYQSTYVEPFAGMLGVLLQRRRVRSEIVNDLDGNVYRWWTCLRDHTQELLRLIMFTPTARESLIDAIDTVDDEEQSCCARSAAFATILMQSVNQARPTSRTWRRRLRPVSTPRKDLLHDRLAAVAERMALVQIENTDAVELLDRRGRDLRGPAIPADSGEPVRDRRRRRRRADGCTPVATRPCRSVWLRDRVGPSGLVSIRALCDYDYGCGTQSRRLDASGSCRGPVVEPYPV